MRPVSKRALPVIRVFVSSTFSDLKHERNALHTQVWHELERYCKQRPALQSFSDLIRVQGIPQ